MQTTALALAPVEWTEDRPVARLHADGRVERFRSLAEARKQMASINSLSNTGYMSPAPVVTVVSGLTIRDQHGTIATPTISRLKLTRKSARCVEAVTDASTRRMLEAELALPRLLADEATQRGDSR